MKHLIIFLTIVFFFNGCTSKKITSQHEQKNKISNLDTLMITYKNKNIIPMKLALKIWINDSFGCQGKRSDFYYNSDFFTQLRKFDSYEILKLLGEPFMKSDSTQFTKEWKKKYLDNKYEFECNYYIYVISAGDYWCNEEMSLPKRNFDNMSYYGISISFNYRDSIIGYNGLTGGG